MRCATAEIKDSVSVCWFRYHLKVINLCYLTCTAISKNANSYLSCKISRVNSEFGCISLISCSNSLGSSFTTHLLGSSIYISFRKFPFSAKITFWLIFAVQIYQIDNTYYFVLLFVFFGVWYGINSRFFTHESFAAPSNFFVGKLDISLDFWFKHSALAFWHSIFLQRSSC